MLTSYPRNSEYEYLQWQVDDLYHQERDTLEPICDEARDCLLSGNLTEAERLFAEFDERRKQLLQERWRREEIIYRLWLDTRLRQEGAPTLADIWERVDEKFEPLEKKLERF